MIGTMDLCITDHGKRASREQATQTAIALLADAPKPVIAPARTLLGTSPVQAKRPRPDRKALDRPHSPPALGQGHTGDRILVPIAVGPQAETHDKPAFNS